MSGGDDALLFDGRSAGARAVDVEVSGDALIIHAPGEDVREWPYSTLEVLDRGNGLRLRSSADPDSRLRLSNSLSDQLFRAAPKVFSSGGRNRDQLALIAALTAGAAAIGAVLFIGVPLAARPLTLITPPSAETTLGANVSGQLALIYPRCEGPRAQAAEQAARPVLDRLYNSQFEPFELSFHFADTPVPNAMALPGGYVMATRGLIETLDHPDQFAAVMAHEIAHVRNRDALTGLYRSAGLGLLLDLVTGGSGLGQQIILLAGQATSLQYTRAQEARADEDALRLLEASKINPTALAEAFERMQTWSAGQETAGPGEIDLPEWLSSHPDTDKRIERARAVGDKGFASSLSQEAWETIRNACSD
ncbi:MAG: M48 family metallopeptidase [Alphaproteobacteria bacterium]|nr:M48 family metallopeptidase [Alphaproteobacteria bacterium]